MPADCSVLCTSATLASRHKGGKQAMKTAENGTIRTIKIEENGIYIVIGILADGTIRLLHFSAAPLHEEDITAEAVKEGFPLVGLSLSGYDRPYERHGNKYIVTAPGYRLKYHSHTDESNAIGRKIVFHLIDEQTKVAVYCRWQFFTGLPVIRCQNTVENRGSEEQTVEYISNFHYEGIEKEGKRRQDDKLRLYIPHNSWQREMNWKEYSLRDLGLDLTQPKELQRSSSMIRVTNTGNWSTKEYLPMAYLENTETGTGLFWQIEHNGSWHWEIGDQNGHLYLALGGPNELYSHWAKRLRPGESFTTVPASAGVTVRKGGEKNGFGCMAGILTQYRRRIRRPNEDNIKLPVIFNDYMNCLWGKPTEEQEIPMIDAAAEAGCEYYCIDAGWYADGDWWDSVGEWQVSRKRFPEGLKKVTDYIRSRGMIPGVWLEPEVMGIHCDLARKVPKDWFFIRHGRPVYDRSRFQLDYRNPDVRAYMDSVVNRLVQEYGVGYIKMDYNIEPGIGTEIRADSPGDGLLEHERAYLRWLDGLFERFPGLVIENCSSGGLRMDYAMLSRLSIQSTSDTDDYMNYPVIAANASAGITPEQAAVWSYPMEHDTWTDEEELREETIFNMVSSMLLRIHLSGHLVKLDDLRKTLVKDGIAVYKKIRSDIPHMLPFWPLGPASYQDEWIAFGLKSKECAYLAVWKRKVEDSEGNEAQEIREIQIPLPEEFVRTAPEAADAGMESPDTDIRCVYPSGAETDDLYIREGHALRIRTKKPFMARLFRITAAKAEEQLEEK